MGQLVLLSLLSAFSPTLLAATTVMLLLPDPRRPMLGYLLGALVTSITLGLVIEFALRGASGLTLTTQHSLNPAVDVALGALMVLGAAILATGHPSAIAERPRRHAGDAPPRWQRSLSRGTLATAIVIGGLMSLPGATYLLALHVLRRLRLPAAETVLIVIAFNIVMLALLEVPLLCYVLWPRSTPAAIDRAKAWTRSRARPVAVWGLSLIGGALLLKGLVALALGG